MRGGRGGGMEGRKSVAAVVVGEEEGGKEVSACLPPPPSRRRDSPLPLDCLLPPSSCLACQPPSFSPLPPLGAAYPPSSHPPLTILHYYPLLSYLGEGETASSASVGSLCTRKRGQAGRGRVLQRRCNLTQTHLILFLPPLCSGK